MKNRASATIAVLLVVLALMAVPIYRALFPPVRPGPSSPSAPAGSVTSSPGEAAPPSMPGKIVIYTVSPDGGGDDNNLVAQTIPAMHGQSPARDALHALIRVDNSPLPDGTRLRGIKIEDGLATVDFTREFQTNFHGGDTQEAQTINAILLTMGQFPSIDRVQILVEGKPIDALSQLPIGGPLDVIRPQNVRQARSGGGGE